ncbi:CdvA-like protein, partial [Candidatus Bathyarchaeota archaeon]|nr:CdvA-like protein [Candidatus Bathyarchaeota archaeon]
MKNMGLNDLTIEKLISEINGYKEKMRAIHEDYGRASSDLQDRINVLGYTLNEHLKETKDQMATTPQRLLNLEAKYVTGEVSDNEYFSQRQEFKGLLAKNLQSIEEIKQMIDVLSHIETKPLSPGEFKQTYPENKIPAGVSWVGAGAVAQAKPWSPSPTPPISPATNVAPIKPAVPETVVEAAPEPSLPVPAIPQNNGNTAPAPETTNAPTAPLDSLSAAPAPVDSPVQSAETGSSSVLDESLISGPAQDVVEDVADALVVKVVDDIPTIDASAAVATT